MSRALQQIMGILFYQLIPMAPTRLVWKYTGCLFEKKSRSKTGVNGTIHERGFAVLSAKPERMGSFANVALRHYQ